MGKWLWNVVVKAVAGLNEEEKFMKKKVISLLLVATMAFAATGCGSSADATDANGSQDAATAQTTEAAQDSTQADANAEGTRTALVVGFDAEYPPYGYMDDNGEYTGFDLELAKEVCDRNGWELVKQPINWDSKDQELNSGSIDCIWNGFTMTGREDAYTWSEPYVDNSIVIVVAADSDIQSLSDLAGKVVETQADSSALAALTSEEDNDENLALTASFAALEQVADYNTAFMNLESGAADAIAVDIGVAKYQVESRGDTFRMLEEEVSKEQYAVGFKLGNTELRDIVQATLDEMATDGTVAEIAEKYADYNVPDMLCIGQ